MYAFEYLHKEKESSDFILKELREARQHYVNIVKHLDGRLFYSRGTSAPADFYNAEHVLYFYTAEKAEEVISDWLREIERRGLNT